jgi:ABC-type nitrate/sulfonate/bicarbonate transport system substrate-binding protein
MNTHAHELAQSDYISRFYEMPVRQAFAASFCAMLAAFSGTLTATKARAQTGEKLSLTLAVAPIVPYSNSSVALAKGMFTEANLSVERKTIMASDVIRSALASGDVDIAAMSLDTVLRAHIAGFDWKLLYPAVVYDPKTPDAYIVARKDLDYKTPKDLEGKIIAMSSGSISEVGAKAWLRMQGVDISKVKIVEIPLPQMVSALESKQIDAGHMVYPGVSVALGKGVGKLVGPDLDAIGGRFLVSTYVAKGSWIKANPEKAKRFTAAMKQATSFIMEKPADALPIIAKETRIEPALVADFFPSRYVASTAIPAAEIQRVIDFLLREKFIEKSMDYRDIVSEFMPMVP